MLSFEKFKQLAESTINQYEVEMSIIGKKAEHLQSWVAYLPRLHRSEQYQQLRVVLGEMIVANINDEFRIKILESVYGATERLVAQMQLEYVHNPQGTYGEQRTCMKEVRSLYFLLILAYKGVADRHYDQLLTIANQTNTQKQGNTWFNKITDGLSSSLVRKGAGIDFVNANKRLFTIAVYRMMSAYYCLSMEFALAYQPVPNAIWGQMNAWYLKAATQTIDRTDVNQLDATLTSNSIHQKYLQTCLVSFTNLFAYRRTDIVNIFKIVPSWIKYVKSTFVVERHLKIFVNLKAATPPELITPYATVNPYSDENVCLFFDVRELFERLQSLQTIDQGKANDSMQFESRLAKIILLAFKRQSDNTISNVRINEYVTEMASGFFTIFYEVSGGRAFSSIIEQSSLPDAYLPKIKSLAVGKKELVKVMTKSDTSTHFICGDLGDYNELHNDKSMLTAPCMPVFSLFALKSFDGQSRHPWRLGIVHWVEPTNNQIGIDGQFLGQILAAGGIRLTGRDARSRDFVQALLLSGDGLHQQATLILPRYHFRVGDTVVFRIDGKESSLRLEKNLLSTDDIEQYKIARLI